MQNKIYDRPLAEKLGVKAGHKITVLGIDDEAFVDELQSRKADVRSRLRAESDLIFYGADNFKDLKRLQDLRGYIKPDGAIWVVRRKGAEATIKDTDVINAGLDAHMVDNKIASFSDTQAAMRLVIRIRDRPALEVG
ncbi:MAG TPA: hypothetical protein VG329_09820 [Candidatus Dormibacteraeota bacterium]|jgi:hypothetical protein|nr:hypothetical protein [Candidatus Dormibacteraeota bacterium]